jgi:DNA-binding transcriptional LysR family regulator
MLIRHLTYFSVLAREQHFARAAEACNVAQPTLSAGIRTLEQTLGARLVVRGRNYVGLTAEGERVLAWAQQILVDYDSLVQDLDDLGKGLSGTLRLGVIPAAMPCTALITDALLRRHPGMSVDIRSMTSKAIQRGLDEFEIDAAVTYLDNEPLVRVRRLALYVERFVLATGRQGLLGERAAITWREAAGLRLCLLSDDMQNRRIIDAVLHGEGLDVAPPVTANSFLALNAHLLTGAWSSIVPHTFGRLFGRSDDIALIPLTEPSHSQTIGLVVCEREPQSPTARAVWSCAQGLGLQAALEGDAATPGVDRSALSKR